MGRIVQTITLAPDDDLSVIENLAPKTTYEIEVRNVREGVIGEPTTMTFTTEDDPPGQPVIFLKRLGASTMTIGWVASEDGGEATSWTLRNTRTGGTTTSTNVSMGATREYAYTGLANRATYTVTLDAFNDGGVSFRSEPIVIELPSATGEVSTPRQLQTGSIRSEVTTNSATVRFRRLVTGGIDVPPYEYVVQFYRSSDDTLLRTEYVIGSVRNFESTATRDTPGYWQSNYEITFDNLNFNTTYYVDISGQNGTRRGLARRHSFTTTDLVPGVPTQVIASVIGYDTMTVEWIKDTTAGTAATYLVELAEDATFETGKQMATVNESAMTTLNHVFTGLTPETEYYFRVTARNSIGNAVSPIVQADTIIKPVFLPNPPRNLVINPRISRDYRSHDRFNFSVQFPTTDANHDAATHLTYTVSLFPNFTSPIIDEATVTSPQLVTGLKPFTRYYLRVQAHNTGGGSSYLTGETVTDRLNVPARVSPAPVVSAITPTGATITWTKPATTNHPSSGHPNTPTGYQVAISGGDGLASSLNEIDGGDTLTFDAEGLEPSTAHTVEVYGRNNAGLSATASSSASFTTLDPAPPVISVAEATPTSLVLTWIAGTETDGTYTLQYRKVGTTAWTEASTEIATLGYTIDNLEELTGYNIRVSISANNLWSDETAIFTTGSVIRATTLEVLSTATATSYPIQQKEGSVTSGNYYWRWRKQAAGETTFGEWTTINQAGDTYTFTTTQFSGGNTGDIAQVEGRRGTSGPWSEPITWRFGQPYFFATFRGAGSTARTTTAILNWVGGTGNTLSVQHPDPDNPSIWRNIGNQPRLPATSLVLSSLTAGTMYRYRIKRYSSAISQSQFDAIPWSYVLTFTTLTEAEIVPSTVGISARNFDDLTATVVITPPAEGVVNGYLLQVSPDVPGIANPSFDTAFGSTATITSYDLPANTRTYRLPDNSFLPNAVNRGRIRAFNDIGNSLWGGVNFGHGVQSEATGPTVTLTAVSSTSVRVQASGGNPNYYGWHVQWTEAVSPSQDETTIIYDNNFYLNTTIDFGETAPATVDHTITGLTAGTSYWISVQRYGQNFNQGNFGGALQNEYTFRGPTTVLYHTTATS